MPNKERIQLLVQALRSGKYRQGKYALNRYDRAAKKRKLCCLGVACEVAKLGGLPLKINKSFDEINYDGNRANLPLSVQEWFGLNLSDPTLLDEANFPTRATDLNDTLGYKFGQIADAFERTYLNNNNQ